MRISYDDLLHRSSCLVRGGSCSCEGSRLPGEIRPLSPGRSNHQLERREKDIGGEERAITS